MALLLVAAAACASVATTSPTAGSETSTSAAPQTSVAPSVEDSIAVDAAPTAIATGSKQLWIASSNEIVALDPTTGATTAHVPVSGTVAMTLDTNIATSSADPPRLAACSADQTVEIGTVTHAISATYPYGCTGIAVGAGALWIVRDDQLVELGPQGDLAATVPVDHGLGVAATNDAVWIIEGESGHAQLRQIEPGFHTTIATFALDGQPDAVIADDAGVWVSERSDNGTTTLLGFGTPSSPLPRRYPPGSGGTGLDFSGQFLWVANDDGGASAVDTNTGDLVDLPMLSSGPAASAVRLVAADGRVFLTGREAGAVQRVHPGSYGDSMRWGDAPTPTRIEVTSGCPTSIANAASVVAEAPFANPDPTGLADTLIPARPDGAVICRYTDIEATVSALGSRTYVGGALRQQAALDADGAVQLANTINAAVAAGYFSTCTADFDGPEYTAVAFSTPGRSDIDIWYEDYANCPLLSNGQRVISPLINGFGADVSRLLDTDLTPAHVDGATATS